MGWRCAKGCVSVPVCGVGRGAGHAAAILEGGGEGGDSRGCVVVSEGGE